MAEDGGSVRAVLVPVYRALELDCDPATASSVREEVGATWADVEKAIIAEIRARYDTSDGALDDETLELAARLEPDHVARPQ